MGQRIEAIYPVTEWDIIEPRFEPAHNYRNETIFALGNGFIGMRGTFEEVFGADVNGLDGTYLNGFYESEIIKYPEIAYGYAEKSQTMLNVPNAKIIQIFLEDEPFRLLDGEILAYERVLRLKTGLLERRVHWRSPRGREILVEARRLICFEHKHLATIQFGITPLNFSGRVRVASVLNGDVSNQTAGSDPRVGSGLQGRVLAMDDIVTQGEFAALRQHTINSGLMLVCGVQNVLQTTCGFLAHTEQDTFTARVIYDVEAQAGVPFTLQKYIAYVTTQDYPERVLLDKAQSVVEAAKAQGFEQLEAEQAGFMKLFWQRADIVIQGDVALQQGIRFNMFHLLQSVGRDGKTSIAAKGLTGEGYEGHYFWDSEMYVLPFFLHTFPSISQKMLEYRHRVLPQARARARQMSHQKGALFSWRTINGEECSAYYPAGTAQYHINADIAYAIKQHVETTGDIQFLLEYGAEILIETARFWVDLGDYIPHRGQQFCINGVTGPDEYTAVVNNNCFTNLMAQENLRFAYDVVMRLEKDHPAVYAALAAKMGLGAEEPAAWKQAADRMYIPYDEKTQLYLQDDSFLDKAPWDFENTPDDHYPLLLHYHPLVIYRHQVCKQADLVLALFLLSGRFTLEEKQRNYDFYEQFTTHDSSLSTCIFSIVASEIGYREQAYRYFMSTARMDLDDYHHNVKDGVHIANMAGTWMCLVYGFAGLRMREGLLTLKPYLPDGWDGYRFALTCKQCVLRVSVTQAQTQYELVEGDTLKLIHHDEHVELSHGQSCTKPNPTVV